MQTELNYANEAFKNKLNIKLPDKSISGVCIKLAFGVSSSQV